MVQNESKSFVYYVKNRVLNVNPFEKYAQKIRNANKERPDKVQNTQTLKSFHVFLIKENECIWS